MGDVVEIKALGCVCPFARQNPIFVLFLSNAPRWSATDKDKFYDKTPGCAISHSVSSAITHIHT